MICISAKKNPKLLQTFNNDPYADVTIHTASTQLNLVLGYLSIDSVFFDEVTRDAKQINLSHLNEGPLIKILRSLYGEQLYAYNIAQLSELYEIITFLKILEYKDNIKKYILANKQLMDSFQLIQFCFSKQILKQQVRKHHYSLKLSVLASTKNYLQLNKLSMNTLNSLLLQYSELKGEQADQTINSIIENYLGRTDMRPNDYFMQPGMQHLLNIWQKFHHSIGYLLTAQQKVRQSQIFNAQDMKRSMMQTMSYGQSYPLPNLTTSPSISIATSTYMPNSTPKLNYQTSTYSAELRQRDQKIQHLEKQLQTRKNIAEHLQNQIALVKRQLNLKRSNKIIDSDQEQDKRGNKGNTTIGADYDVSLIQPAVNQNRKVVNDQYKEVKTMNKLNQKTDKSKRIFY